MLLGSPRTLSDSIMKAFMQKPSFTVKGLQKQLSALSLKTSERALYKELKQLIEDGVLTKVGKEYQVSLKWALELQNYSETLIEKVIHPRCLRALIPEVGKSATWRFTSLQKMDRLFVELMFILTQISEEKTIYEWVPNFWFYLVDYDQEVQAMRAFEISERRMKIIVGNDNYLNRLPQKFLKRSVFQFSYAKGPFDRERDSFFCVYDDYILTAKSEPRINRKIDEAFGKINKLGAKDLALLTRIFSESTKCSITLERKKNKAKKLRKKFEEYF